MKKRISASFVLALVFVMISQIAHAQFQGHINMNIYNNEDGITEKNELNMYVTKNRIFIQGEDNVSFADGVKSNGLLVRNDTKDFILMMDKNEALKITKTEIEGLFSMIGMMGSIASTPSSKGAKSEPNFRYSNKERTINGFKTSQLIIDNISDGNKGDYLSVWLTPKIDINWGMLAEPWKNLPADVESTVNGAFRQTVFSGNNFPILIEAYDAEKGETFKVLEVISITKSNVAQAKVDVPNGTTIVGLNQLMMKMMMGN